MDVLPGEVEQEPGLMWEEAGNNSNNYTRAAAPSTTNSSTMAFVPKGELYTISPPPPPILVALGYGPSNLFQLYSVFVCVSTVSAQYLARFLLWNHNYSWETVHRFPGIVTVKLLVSLFKDWFLWKAKFRLVKPVVPAKNRTPESTSLEFWPSVHRGFTAA